MFKLANDEVLVFDRQLKTTRPLLYFPGTAIAISADSRYAAFADQSVHRVEIETGRHAYRQPEVYRTPAAIGISGDGNWIVVEGEPSVIGGQSTIVDMIADGQDVLTGLVPGQVGIASTTRPSISADGRFITYLVRATNVVGGRGVDVPQVVVKDRVRGTTTLLSGGPGGAGNARSAKVVLAENGRTVVFESAASDLVAGDENGLGDIFIANLPEDSDGDGMDDDWEVAMFGSLAEGAQGDADHDGASNIEEFRAGTDPNNAGSIFRVISISTVGSNERRLVWSGEPGREYQVQCKDAVAAAWTTLSTEIMWNGQQATAVDTNGTAARYYRVVRK